MGEKGNDPAAAAAGLSSRLSGSSAGSGSAGVAGSMDAMRRGSEQLDDMRTALEQHLPPPAPGS
jgi:hypothetical protein